MTCESHSRRCCWITTEKDAASLAHYRIPIGTHINITDTEMWKWVEQWVRFLILLLSVNVTYFS